MLAKCNLLRRSRKSCRSLKVTLYHVLVIVVVVRYFWYVCICMFQRSFSLMIKSKNKTLHVLKWKPVTNKLQLK